MAKSEEVNLVAAIQQYYAQYSRLPASSAAVAAAASATANSNDFTFGTMTNLSSSAAAPAGNPIQIQTAQSSYQNFNSEVIAILQDDNFYPESSNGLQHIYNPQQSSLFTAKVVPTTNSPGIGPDYVFRDPWNNPYIITLDLNYDGKCFDFALNQMYNSTNLSAPGFTVPGEAIVWSMGPNATTINLNAPLNTGVNHKTIVASFQ